MSGLLLQEGEADKSLTPMQRESMQMIVSSGDLLLTVVNDVLDYSKLETGNVDINPRLNNLQETLNALIHSIEMKDVQQRVSVRTFLDPKLPEFVTLDSQRLQQILFNLLGNALRFSNMKKGGIIEFGVELDNGSLGSERGGYVYTQREREKQTLLMSREPAIGLTSGYGHLDDADSMHTEHSSKTEPEEYSIPDEEGVDDGLSGKPVLRFRVKDYGKGIEQKDFARIFQPFQQASAETEQVYGGTGLGLAITGKLVHAMGGVIAVDSVIGEWTEFTVELPFQDSPFDVQAATAELSSTTVFIVEDNREHSDQLVNTLDHCGIAHKEFRLMSDAELFFTDRFTPIPSELSHIFLVNEDLHNEDSFELASNIATCGLITFGPKYSVRGRSHHFISPNKVLPSVLLKSFEDLLRSVRRPHSRTPSLCSSAQSIHRYALRILIAEDNSINQRVLHRMLSRIGVTDVTIVDNGQKAVDACLENDFHLIFMDCQMPVMDGLQACREIMARPEIETKPKIVFATAHVAKSFEEACLAAGGADFHGFLPKPFTLQDIENCLDNIVFTTWIG